MSKEDQFKKTTNIFKDVALSALKKGTSRSADLSIKTDQFENYKYKGEIARGGIKVILRMTDQRTGRDVAVACLRPELQKGSHIERFFREARILANLEHPNIVPLYEIDFDNSDTPFFSMKFLKGETLAQIIKNKKSDKEYEELFPLDALLSNLVRVCDAIAYAHSKGVIHLDLKPENIQVSEFGDILVLDWGIAKYSSGAEDYIPEDTDILYSPLQNDITQIGTINGTPGFMAPEQIEKKHNDFTPATDVYAIGAILYTIVCQRRPFEGDSIESILKKSAAGEIPPFSDEKDDNSVPNALKAIIRKAMSKDPEVRYESAESIKADILSYLHGYATQAENVNLLTLLFLFYKRQKKFLQIIGASLTIILIIGGLSYLSIKEEQRIAEVSKKQAIESGKKVDEFIEVRKATTPDIIHGTLALALNLSSNHRYVEALSAYDKLISLNYITEPHVWYYKALLHLGELQLQEASYSFDQANRYATPADTLVFGEKSLRLQKQLSDFLKRSPDGKMSYMEGQQYATASMDIGIREHIIYKLNTGSQISLEEKIKNLPDILKFTSAIDSNEPFNFKCKIGDNQLLEIDLSGNDHLFFLYPLIGLKIKKLDISNCKSISPSSNRLFNSEHLRELDISNSFTYIHDPQISNSYITHLAARNCIFYPGTLGKLEYLDLQGASIKNPHFSDQPKFVKYLNLAHTNFRLYSRLINYKQLETLVIDASVVLPEDVTKSFKERNVKVVVIP